MVDILNKSINDKYPFLIENKILSDSRENKANFDLFLFIKSILYLS